MPLIKRGNCNLEYIVAGKKTLEDGSAAPVITFIHGAGGNAMTWWATTPSFVGPPMGKVTPESGKQEYYTICISYRGWGQSRIDAEDPLEFVKAEHFAPDLLAVLDAEGVEKTALVCHSYGGFVGVLTACAAPERVTALVMVSTKFGLKFPDPAEDQMRKDYEEKNYATRGQFEDFDAKGTLEEIRSRLSYERLRALPSIDPKIRIQVHKQWFTKEPELMNLRFLLSASNHQLNEMGIFTDPAKTKLIMDPVEDLGIDAPTFRSKFPGKVHFMVPLDDAAVPWEFCALIAERLGAGFEEFDTDMGDHSIMFFSPEMFCMRLRAVLEA